MDITLSPAQLLPSDPFSHKPIFFAPVLTEEETVTPPCKEMIRVGDVGATVTSLDFAMSLVLRKDSVEGARSNQFISKPLWSDCRHSAHEHFFTAEFIIQSTCYPR